MSIRNRLFIGFGILFFVVLLQVVGGWWLAREARNTVQGALGVDRQAIQQLFALSIDAQQLRRFEKEYFIYVNSADGRNKYFADWTATQRKLAERIDRMAGMANVFDDAERAEIAKWKKAAEYYRDEFMRLAAAVTAQGASEDSMRPQEVNRQIGPGKDRFALLLKGAEDMLNARAGRDLESIAAARRSVSIVNLMVWPATGAGLVIAVMVMLSVVISVRRPIERLSQVVDELSLGKLQAPIPDFGVPEFKSVSTALERLRVSLLGMMDRMRRKA